jgi:hypothetical protein
VVWLNPGRLAEVPTGRQDAFWTGGGIFGGNEKLENGRGAVNERNEPGDDFDIDLDEDNDAETWM